MIAVLLNTLFVVAGTLAIAAIVDASCRYGRAALLLKEQLETCEDRRDLRIAIREITVRRKLAVLRPVFTPRPAADRPVRPSRSALPVAA